MAASGWVPLVGTLSPDGDGGSTVGSVNIVVDAAAHAMLGPGAASLHIDPSPWWLWSFGQVDALWWYSNRVRPVLCVDEDNHRQDEQAEQDNSRRHGAVWN